MRLAVDTGGTFTDLVVSDDDRIFRIYKVPTVPHDRTQGVLAALELAAGAFNVESREFLSRVELIVHGTTTATNAIITGSTARTAFLTTAGHRDLLVLREGGRMGVAMFDYSVPYPKPYVPRALTFEVEERIGSSGEIVTPLNEQSVKAVATELRKLEVEAVAVCLLWSIVNNTHELRVGELLEALLPGIPITLSHVLNPTIREYRRASSACIDASLKPVMTQYLSGLAERLNAAGFTGRLLVVTSQGSVRDASEVAQAPIHSVKSGPAMAPVAGRYFAERDSDVPNAIVTDTGGTTFDVSLVRAGQIPETRETWLGAPFLGHMTGFPSIDVRSVGAGGGSIASVDEAGLLRVGPRSAGAAPGPACYGAGGTEPTLTDAYLLLGVLDAQRFLAGRLPLDADAAHSAIASAVAEPLNMSAHEAAQAIVDVAVETMALAIEDITVNQGIDPVSAILVGGGGAAGLNSVAIARRIGARQVLFPAVGSVLSAAGGLLCDLGGDFAEHFFTTRSRFDKRGVASVFATLDRRCHEFARRVSGDEAQVEIEFAVEARYEQQVWEIKLPLASRPPVNDEDVDSIGRAFHALHQAIFAVHDDRADIEFLTWRARATCSMSHAQIPKLAVDRSGQASERRVRLPGFEDGNVRVLSFGDSALDQPCRGPVIVETGVTTIALDRKTLARRTSSGGLLVEVEP